jgi:simple sugar transport system permease protein
MTDGMAGTGRGARARLARWSDTVGPALLPPLLALAIAAVAGDLLILAFGEAPATVFRLLVDGTWGNAYGIGQVLYKATTLTCTGLAFALAARGGLFNVGAEGQIAAGGFGAAAVGLLLPAGTPALLAVPAVMAGALVAGALVGAVPGVLRARFGASEVIVTIMLNFVVLAFLSWLLTAHLALPETVRTPALRAGTLPRLDAFLPALHGSAVNGTLLVALGAAAAVWFGLFRTAAGFALRATGAQPAVAEYAGIRVPRMQAWSLVLGGALAGLGGINFVQGYKGYYEDGFGAGNGFLGIAVAMMGRNHPVGIVLAALLFGTLSQGGLAVNAVVPKELTDILTAVVILAVAVTAPEVRRLWQGALAQRTAQATRAAVGAAAGEGEVMAP